MAQPTTHSRTLRLFGVSTARASAVLRQAAAEGCPGLRLMGRNGELAVRLAASGPDAASVCEGWEKKLQERFGPAVFSTDATDLPQAALDAFLKEEFLFCSADEATGALLEPLLRDLPRADGAYDFGKESWAHPRKAGRIEPPAGWLRRWPACPVQPAAGRAAAALKVSEADFALVFQPAQGRYPAFALLADERSAWVKALNRTQAEPAQAGLWLLDMARRAAQGQPQAEGVQMFRLGQEAPALVADPEENRPARPAAPAAAPAPAVSGDTGRVPPLRLAPDPDPQPTRVAVSQPTRQAVSAPPKPSEPTGVVRLEPVGRNARLEKAAQAMYGLVDESAVPDTEPPAPKKQGSYWGRILAAVFFLLVVAVAAAAGLYYWNSLGEAPAWRSYGTAGFDANAISYLERAQEKDDQVAAYLALPGMTGSLIYTDGDPRDDAPAGAALAAEDTGPQRVCYAPGADPAQTTSHSLVLCPAQALRELGGLDQLDAVQSNSAFTLYTGNSEAAAYRYKVAAVFYWDPAEEGEGAFDLASFTDLSDANTFMDFVVGIKARSLFDMPVDFEEGDSFVSLVADAAEPDGTKLVVVGRKVREQETRSVDTANIAPTTDPLLTAAMYSASGASMPDMLELMQSWVNWFGGRNQTNSDLQIEAGMPEEDVQLDAILDSLGEVPDLDDLMPEDGPTPTPNLTPNPETETGLGGGTGDTGLPPEATLPPVTTPAPTAVPTDPGDGSSGGSEGGETTPAPTAPPTTSSTINVTMNGTPQTMDLTECLAMIVMNEVGSSAPAEAQKAQAIAAHSWILSQGTAYPSVAGRTPTDSVRANVAEVAHIVVAYGNTVAFTPYHASCAGGTTASVDVWGGVRNYLIEVESPYDASTATNWETTEVYSSATVAARAKEKLGIDLTGNPSTWLEVTSTTTYGYVKGVRIGSVTKSGTYLQSTLLGGQTDIWGRKRTMRSPAFTVQYDASQDAFIFTVRGYGHGVGMSQWGAIGYARAGWNYSQILAHYYPGTTLVTVG